MADPSRAVFLSYASEDTEAARRICDALREVGLAVWFDQSELRGGDAWDQRIRREIRDCALFVPIISASTQARLEGYFRREWKLAIARTHDMADERAFLLPVVIDDTNPLQASVPEPFRSVQWMRLPAGEVPPAFVERVAQLLSAVETGRPTTTRRTHGAAPAIQPVSPGLNAVPEHSIAVLPFVNMSADKEQEYFSDGLAEELINLLARIPELRVPARTSSFSFRGRPVTAGEIGQALKVAHVLEGSVRKAGNRLRIGVQLVRSDSGYQLWSETFDRTLDDIFQIQDDIARAVVDKLKLTLLAAVPSATTGATSARPTTSICRDSTSGVARRRPISTRQSTAINARLRWTSAMRVRGLASRPSTCGSSPMATLPLTRAMRSSGPRQKRPSRSIPRSVTLTPRSWSRWSSSITTGAAARRTWSVPVRSTPAILCC